MELEQDKERVYIEVDLVQELVLGMAVELEQGMAEEQVQVCTEDRERREVSALSSRSTIENILEEDLVQEQVQDMVEEQESGELELRVVERECS